MLGHTVIWGSPGDDSTWSELDELLKTTVKHPGGGTLKLDAAIIDSGDGAWTAKVYDYCRARFARKILAGKGVAGNRPPLQRSSAKGLRRSETSEVSLRTAALTILKSFDLQPGEWDQWKAQDLEPDKFVAELEYLSSSEGEEIGIVAETLPPEYRLAAELFYSKPEEVKKMLVPTLSEVKEKHMYFKPKLRVDDQFHRAFSRFVEVNGDLPVDKYKREHGNLFVSALIAENLKGSTVKRYLAQVRPIFETARTELEIEMSNPLSNLKIPNKSDDEEEGARSPFSQEQILEIQRKCREVDDQRRWLIALLSDTGCRLAEATGLFRNEVVLEGPVPHLIIQPNKLRRLKNSWSRRKTPLVGEALWAVGRALERNETDYLFPELVKNGAINPASVSAALNAWLKAHSLREDQQPLHSFRHSLRDRLRNAGVPPDVQDRIGGWARKGVGESYGAGHSLEVLHRHMRLAITAGQEIPDKAA